MTILELLLKIRIMKNIFFLCLFLLIMVSCKKDPKTDKLEVVEEIVDSTDVVAEEIVAEEPVAKKKKKPVAKKKPKDKKIAVPPGAPTFNSRAARKYIRDYEAYIANYKKAVKAKDMDSFLELNEASSSLTKQYRSLISTLSGEEIKKMSKYIQAKSKQIEELSKQM